MKFNIFKRNLKKKLSFNISDSLVNKNTKKITNKNKLRQTIGRERELIFSRHAKSKVSQIPKLMSSFIEMFEKIESSKAKEFSMTLKSSSKKPIVVSLKSLDKPSINSYHTKEYLLFEIKSGSSSSKYFVKFTNSSMDIMHGFQGASEIKALDVISKAGFNVVPAHLGYVDKVKKRSFIFYEYQSKLVDAEIAFKNKLITSKDVMNIRRNLLLIETKVNKSLESYNRLKLSKNSVVRDVYPHETKEVSSIPVFIDFNTKKLFIYDPWLSSF